MSDLPRCSRADIADSRRSGVARALTLGVWLACAGAGAQQVVVQPTEVPVRFQQAGRGLVEFVAALPSTAGNRPGAPEDLAALRRVLLAARQHPDYGVALAKVEAASGVVSEARAARLPQVTGGSTVGDRRFNGVDYRGQRASLGVSQLVYDFGKTSGLVDSATNRREAAQARLSGEEGTLVLRALAAWAELFRARQQLELQRLNVSSRAEITEVVRERAEIGGGTFTDVLRARARLADAEATVSVGESRLQQAEAAWFAFFRSSAPSGLLAPPGLFSDATPDEPDVPDLARELFTVREAVALQASAMREADALAAAALPQLNIEASLAHGRDRTLPNDQTLLMSFRYNIFTGGSETARVEQARARVRESERTAESTLQDAELSIRQAIAEVRRGDRGVPARRHAVEVAGDTLAAVIEQFAYRRGTLLDLLRAQEDLYFAGRDYIDAMTDHAIARFRLALLSGRLVRTLEDLTSR